MLVREIMHSPVVTVGGATTLAAAYATLQERGIRHLPVVEDGRLVGVVTDRDLRLATSALHPTPFPAAARVDAVMTRDVVTATPLDPVEEAARVMRARKIGCLPVLEGERLAGIITGPDLLDALMRLTGLTRPTGRLAVALTDEAGQFSRLLHALDARGVAVHAVLSYPDADAHPHVILRVGTLNTRGLAEALVREGFHVVWPAPKPWHS